MDKFCERFRSLKAEKKFTYQNLADSLNIKMRSVQKYASGETKPDYWRLLSLADLFAVSLDYLTGRSDQR